MSLPRSAPRWALAALVAVAAVLAVVLVANDDEANGGPEAAAAKADWSRQPSSPLSRTEVGGARIGGSIYVLGRFVPGTGDTTDQVARYDVEAGTWELVDPMPVGVNHPAVASFGGRLYVHGGYTADAGLEGEVDLLQRYDPASGDWTQLSPSGVPRAAHVLVPARKRLWAIGGAHQGGAPLRLVQSYDPAGDRWSAGRAMPTAREHIGGAAVGPRIFVLGGRAGGENLAVAERLDTRSGKWAKLPRMRTARSGFGGAAVRGRVVAVGGEELTPGGATIAPVEIYDPRRKRWSKLPPMITPRHGLAVVAAGRSVFALEGGPNPGLAFSPANEMLRVPRKLLRRGR
ncbi:MAG TPA: kelch repeat-containing protein [Solirubrobacterales bacterium]|nr:kelch repeat-containing protein [Solirubrobacterales bacterium]